MAPFGPTFPRMPQLCLDSTVRVAEGLLACDLSGDTAILQLQSGTYYTMNPVATKVWSLIQQSRRAREVHAALVACYDVDADRCANDLLALLTDLSRNQLIVVSE